MTLADAGLHAHQVLVNKAHELLNPVIPPDKLAEYPYRGVGSRMDRAWGGCSDTLKTLKARP